MKERDDLRTVGNKRGLTAAISLCVLVGFTVVFITSSYFRHGPMEYLLSFVGNDQPEGYAGSVLPRPWGQHFFGDYLLPRWQSELPNPWINSEVKNGPINNYLPFGMFLFWFMSFVPYWVSFFFLTAISTSLLAYVILSASRSHELSSRIQFLVSGVLLTAPFLSLIDRGNIQLLLTSICCLSVACFVSDNKSRGAFFLGLAIALKGYPIFFILLWIKDKRWKDVGISLATAVSATVLPLALVFQGGVLSNMVRIAHNINDWGKIYTESAAAYNNSLTGFFHTLGKLDIPLLSQFSRLATDNFNFIVIICIGIALLTMLSSNASTFDVVLISILLVTICIDFVGMYVLGLYFLVFIVVDEGAQFLSVTRRRVVFGLIGVLMMPKTLPLSFWRDDLTGLSATYAPILSGIATLIIFGTIVSAIFHRHQAMTS